MVGNLNGYFHQRVNEESSSELDFKNTLIHKAVIIEILVNRICRLDQRSGDSIVTCQKCPPNLNL